MGCNRGKRNHSLHDLSISYCPTEESIENHFYQWRGNGQMDRELSNGRKLRPSEWLYLLRSVGKEGVDKNIEGVGLGL